MNGPERIKKWKLNDEANLKRVRHRGVTGNMDYTVDVTREMYGEMQGIVEMKDMVVM